MTDQTATTVAPVTQTGNSLSLGVLAMETVIPHERTDPARVAPLRRALQRDGILKNPPIVMAWRDRYVVLDGATRVKAFRELGFRYIVAQIVSPNDERVRLDTWNHVPQQIGTEALFQLVQTLPDIQTVATDLADLETTMLALDGLCQLVLPDKRSYVIQARPGVDRLDALNELVSTYIHQALIGRTTNHDFDLVKQEFPHLSGLFVFPKFTVEQVLQLSQNGNVVPAGITRFIIPGRVLRLNLDLQCLQRDELHTQKSAWLDDMVETLIANRQVRYYQEPVYLLDE